MIHNTTINSNALAIEDSTTVNAHPQREQSEIETITRLMDTPSGSLGISEVSARFDSRMSINKVTVQVSCLFPLHGAVSSVSLNDALRALVEYASRGEAYDAKRSLLIGSLICFNPQDEQGPTRWHPDLRRVPGSLFATIATTDCPDVQFFKRSQIPMLPGEFASYWPWRGLNEGAFLPAPLHRCDKLFLDYVEAKPAKAGSSATRYLRATFSLELNVREALAQKAELRYATTSKGRIVSAFFDQTKGPMPDGVAACNPDGLSSQEIALGLKRIIDGTMRLYYADLRRALALASEIPLTANPPADWQEALHIARISKMELSNRAFTADANTAFAEMKTTVLQWLRTAKTQLTAQKAEGEPEGLAEARDAFSVALLPSKNNTQVPDVELVVARVNAGALKLTLRLNGYNGICGTMPKSGRNLSVFIAGERYPLPGKTNMAASLDGLVSACLMGTHYARKHIDRLGGSMAPTLEPCAVRAELVINKLLAPNLAEAEQRALKALAKSLRTGKPMEGVHHIGTTLSHPEGWGAMLVRGHEHGVIFEHRQEGHVVAVAG